MTDKAKLLSRISQTAALAIGFQTGATWEQTIVPASAIEHDAATAVSLLSPRFSQTTFRKKGGDGFGVGF